MPTDDSSGFTPFSALDSRRFPKKNGPAVPVPLKKKQPPAEIEEDDGQLFLRAMAGGAFTPQKMDERGSIPRAKGEKRRDVRPVRSETQKTDAAETFPPAQTLEPPAPPDDFAKAMRDVTPLKGRGRDVAPECAPEPSTVAARDSFQDLVEGTLEFALHYSEEYIEGRVLGLDALTMQKLRAGQYKIEAHLDLHGLNARQSFEALLGFVRRAWHKGQRTLLVIPGRGRNSPDGVGVLRERLQSWLTQDPFKRVVLAFCTARPADGGAGGLYVLLRKYKKRGKIYWERMPGDPDLFM